MDNNVQWTIDYQSVTGDIFFQSGIGNGAPPNTSGNHWQWHKTQGGIGSPNWQGSWDGTAVETRSCHLIFHFAPSGKKDLPSPSLILNARSADYTHAWGWVGYDQYEPDSLIEAWASCLSTWTPTAPQAHIFVDYPDPIGPHDHHGSNIEDVFNYDPNEVTVNSVNDISAQITWAQNSNGTWTGTASIPSQMSHMAALDKVGPPEVEGNASCGIIHWLRPHTIGGQPVN